MSKILNVLVACEESQEVCKAFRELGHNAYSCDIQECSGGRPEWHIKGDAIDAMYSRDWDLVIAHPPCTHLAVSGARHFAQKRADGRQQTAIEFFFDFVYYAQNHPSCHVCIENPVCIMSTVWRKPDQIVQPYEYGHPARKKTCLWLFNLPRLTPTNIVSPDLVQYECKNGKTATFSADYICKGDRGKQRSKTYPGIAKAMATQWSEFILNAK